MKTNYDKYEIEFTRSMVHYGYKSFTWFVSRPNYDRSGLLSSHTVWCYTTDFVDVFHMYHNPNFSKADFIKFIKSQPSTRMYNEPVI